jgi:hypothetical protein
MIGFVSCRFFVDCEKLAGDDAVAAEFKYVENCVVGSRVYCVRDPLSTLPTARLMMKM